MGYIYEIYEIYKIYKESIKKYKTNEKYLNQNNFYDRARSWQFTGNLFLWFKNCQAAYMGDLILLKTKQYLILTNPSSNTSFSINTFDPQ